MLFVNFFRVPQKIYSKLLYIDTSGYRGKCFKLFCNHFCNHRQKIAKKSCKPQVQKVNNCLVYSSFQPLQRGVDILCGKRDLNPYSVNYTPLKRARLPVPPLPRANVIILHHFSFVKGYFKKNSRFAKKI